MLQTSQGFSGFGAPSSYGAPAMVQPFGIGRSQIPPSQTGSVADDVAFQLP
jgi:hypothetical protein